MVANESCVLLLNADFTPIKIIEWKRAICLVLDKKVVIVAKYADRFIRSAKMSLPWPSAIALKSYIRILGKAKLSKSNVMLRDRYMCCYCGFKPNDKTDFESIKRLTIDHVVPKVKSQSGLVRSKRLNKNIGLNSWENLVTACDNCNNRKGSNLVADVGMQLLNNPREPTRLQLMRAFLSFRKIPDDWENFI